MSSRYAAALFLNLIDKQGFDRGTAGIYVKEIIKPLNPEKPYIFFLYHKNEVNFKEEFLALQIKSKDVLAANVTNHSWDSVLMIDFSETYEKINRKLSEIEE